MKRIFLLTAVLLLSGGPVVAGELKVMVPIDEFKEMKSRLEALENENSQLKQGGGRAAAAPSPGGEIQSRLQAVESENSRLRQELEAMKRSAGPAPSSADLQARLEAVEKENRQLRESVPAGAGDSTGGGDAALTARLNAAENENSKLQQEVKLLKEGGLAAAYAENKISARELYFNIRKKGISHVYKF